MYSLIRYNYSATFYLEAFIETNRIFSAVNLVWNNILSSSWFEQKLSNGDFDHMFSANNKTLCTFFDQITKTSKCQL